MKGGTWTEATFIVNPVINGKQLLTATFNHSSGEIFEPNRSPDPPVNLHGDNATLIKIQRPLVSPENDDDACMLVYDQFRTFSGHVFKKDNPKFWEEAMRVMAEDSENAKVYRFAKRTGDWKLSVCLDRTPFGNPVW